MNCYSQSIPSCKILEELIDDNILEEDDFNNGDYDPPETEDTIKFTSTRKSYTIEEKLFFVNLLKEKSQHYIAETYGIPEKNLRRWRDQEAKLLLAKNKKYSRRILDKKPGLLPSTIEIEGDLLLHIKHLRDLEICIGSNEIIIKAYQLMPSLRQLSYQGIHTWCYRFMERNHLSFRRVTHIGQPLKDDSSDAMANFILYCKNALNDLNIVIPENLDCIANMDETPIYFEMVTDTTVERIGRKKVNIETFGGEKMRISIILTILVNGEKLPPLIVFKVKPGKTLENNLNSNNQNCISKKIFIKCQENAWVTKDIFKFWLFKI